VPETVTRTDRVSASREGLRPAEVTPEGFLRLDAYLYRGGVQVYRRADGTEQREWRDPEQVLAPEILRRHELLPLVNSHPVLGGGEVRPDNATALVVGTTGQDVRRAGNRARATIMVYDAATIAAIRAGKQELSIGYKCKLDPTPGTTPDGERYDVRQYDWQPNHNAVEHRGRAGDAVVRVDHADAVDELPEPPAPASAQKAGIMEELKKELAEAVAALAAANKRADAAEAAVVAERSARLDAASKIEGARAEVRARLALEQRAAAICPDVFPETRVDSAGKTVERFDGLNDRDLMVAVIKRVDGEDVPADLSDTLVQGFYLSAVKRADRGVADRGALAARHITPASFSPVVLSGGTAPTPVKNSDQLRADAARPSTIWGKA